MKNISIKELNLLLLQNYSSSTPVVYPFGGDYITQRGKIIYCDFDPSPYLISEFLVKRLDSIKWKLLNKPTKEEYSSFLKSVNPLMNIIINFNLQ